MVEGIHTNCQNRIVPIIGYRPFKHAFRPPSRVVEAKAAAGRDAVLKCLRDFWIEAGNGCLAATPLDGYSLYHTAAWEPHGYRVLRNNRGTRNRYERPAFYGQLVHAVGSKHLQRRHLHVQRRKWTVEVIRHSLVEPKFIESAGASAPIEIQFGITEVVIGRTVIAVLPLSGRQPATISP